MATGDPLHTPPRSRWSMISGSFTPNSASPKLAPMLNNTRISLSDKVRKLMVPTNKPERYDFAKVVGQLQMKVSSPLTTNSAPQFNLRKQLSGEDSETEQLKKMLIQLTYLIHAQHSLRSKEMEIKMKQQTSRISSLKRKVCQLEATVANLKKAVTMSMTEQSRQQIVNKRLQQSLHSQQKLLMTSAQDTQRVIQSQAAQLTRQGVYLKGLRSSTTVNPSVVHGVCAVATWYIMHSPQYRLLFRKLHKILAMRKTHRKWIHVFASVQIFYILKTVLPALPLFTSRFWFAMSSSTNAEPPPENTVS